MLIFPLMFAPFEKVRRSIPSDLERLLAPVAPTDARAAALACSGRSGVEKRTMRCVGSYSFPSSSVGHGESSSEVGGLGGPLSSSLKMLGRRTRRRLSRTRPLRAVYDRTQKKNRKHNGVSWSYIWISIMIESTSVCTHIVIHSIGLPHNHKSDGSHDDCCRRCC